MSVLQEGSNGSGVLELQNALAKKGFDPGTIDGNFGPGTEAAVLAFQRSESLTPDGIVGPETRAALGLSQDTKEEVSVKLLQDVTASVTVEQVSKMCPDAPLGHIRIHLPNVLKALSEVALGDQAMVLMAIATIRAETAGFEPISEFKSRFNTSPNGHPFDLYDNRNDLGNQGRPDGASYKGRGFVQLTGRFNYTKFDKELGLGGKLVNDPELANDPKVAAQLLAAFLKSAEKRIRAALREGDLAAARKAVNGGSHGIVPFREAFLTGSKIIG